MCIVINDGQFTARVHPANQVREIVSPLPYSSGLVCHKLPFFYFFSELVSFIGYLDKCETSIFNALILEICIRKQRFAYKYFGHAWKNCWNYGSLMQFSVFNPFPSKPWFLHVCSTSLLKTLLEKKKFLITSNFFFCHSVFFSFGELSAIFINFFIFVCKLFEFGRV